jgi:hypothetical protein
MGIKSKRACAELFNLNSISSSVNPWLLTDQYCRNSFDDLYKQRMLLLWLPWKNTWVNYTSLSHLTSRLQIFVLPQTSLWISDLLLRGARWLELHDSLTLVIELSIPKQKWVFWSVKNPKLTSSSISWLWSANKDWKWTGKGRIVFG